MRGVNKAIIMGAVGGDPDIRYMTNGNAAVNFSVATNESWKDKQGVQQEKTEWHRVVAFGKLAEIIGEYVKKGSKVYIEGKIQTRQWDDKTGTTRYTTEVVASECQFLDSKGSSGAAGGGGGSGGRPHQPDAGGSAGGDSPQFYSGGQGDFEDDIPF